MIRKKSFLLSSLLCASLFVSETSAMSYINKFTSMINHRTMRTVLYTLGLSAVGVLGYKIYRWFRSSPTGLPLNNREEKNNPIIPHNEQRQPQESLNVVNNQSNQRVNETSRGTEEPTATTAREKSKDKEKETLEKESLEKSEKVQKFGVFDINPINRDELMENAKGIFGNLSSGYEVQFPANYIKFQKNAWQIQPFYYINGLIYWPSETRESTISNKVRQYKIHLMPETRDIPKYLREVLNMISDDKKLQEGIYVVKAVVTYPESLYEKHGAPKIVIYVHEKENAQYALNKIYSKFKMDKGCGLRPDFNEQVTDFIFFAQGDRNDKQIVPKLYEGKEGSDKVYFDKAAIEKEFEMKLDGENSNFHLINPAKK